MENTADLNTRSAVMELVPHNAFPFRTPVPFLAEVDLDVFLRCPLMRNEVQHLPIVCLSEHQLAIPSGPSARKHRSKPDRRYPQPDHVLNKGIKMVDINPAHAADHV